MATLTMTSHLIFCLVAGHGGGHIIPTLTTAQHLKQAHPDASIMLFSTTAPLDQKIVQASNVYDRNILLSVENAPSLKTCWRLPIFAAKFIWSWLKSFFYLLRYRPQVVISMGGYVTIPTCLAAYILRIPIDLYELNVEPGRAIMFLQRFARTMYIVHPSTQKYFKNKPCTLTQYPVRFTENDKHVTREQALKDLGLSPVKRTLFIMGGSQGSLVINTALRRCIEQDPTFFAQFNLIHQTGDRESFDWQALYKKHNIPAIIFNYRNDVALLYAACDLIICRAGAGTLAETLFFHKKAIIVPLLADSTQHQVLNAQAMVNEHPELYSMILQSSIEEQPLTLIDRIKKVL